MERRIGKRLNLMGIENALKLARAHPALIRKNFGVVLVRTVRELNGESCMPLEEMPPAKQQIVSSRSFGERIITKVAMQSLDRIWLEGRRYMTAGIMLDNFTPHGVSQLNLSMKISRDKTVRS